MKKYFVIKAKIWKWPGDAGWHFVTLDKKLSDKIRSVYTRGFVPIVAKCGKANGRHRFSRTRLIKKSANRLIICCV